MSGLIWVRINGQAEMRENVREAIKRIGTQDAVAMQAGLTFNKVAAFLGKNRWLARDELEALAKVVEVPADELIGNSIFKEDDDRYAEFDHRPSDVVGPDHDRETAAYKRGVADALGYLKKEEKEKDRHEPTTPIKATDRTRALCCHCGALRTCRADRKGYEPDEGDNSRTAARRCIIRLKCETCGQVTQHAVLRLDEDRDAAELFSRIPTEGEVARRDLDQLIDRLAGFSVDVHFHAGWKPQHDDRDDWNGEPYPLRYEWDTSKSRWRIDLDPAAPASVLLHLLTTTWKSIAEDDFDHEWDSRTTPTIMRAGESTWADAADDLVIDLRRFMTMERERLVLDVRAELDQQADV
jgi:hypothetical protein